MTTNARSNAEFAAEARDAASPRGKGRQPYPERWLSYPWEVRLRLAGSLERLAELDGLAALPDDERATLTGSSLDRMHLVVKRLEAAKELVDALRTERNALMIEQAIVGVQQTRIAEEAGVTAMMVCHALATAAPRARKRRL
jgi:hypothetical protein